MKKLVLRLDDLRVETFTTAEQAKGRGTVEGHYGTTHTAEPTNLCGSCGMTECLSDPAGDTCCLAAC